MLEVPPSSPPAPNAGAPTATNAAATKTRWRRYAPDALPKMVGYGLLVLFALDLLQAAAAYRPFHPEDDQALVLQVLERIAVPLVGYVLIFWWETPSGGRFEQRVRKLLSIGALAIALSCLGLAVMAVHSGFRLYARTVDGISRQDDERIANLQRLAKELPVMSPALVQNTYEELVHRGFGRVPATPLATDDMRRQIAAAVPLAIDASHAATAQATSQARWLQILASGKYFLGGIVCAVLFFLIWDGTADARQFAFFGRRDDPSLTITERYERLLDSIRLIPDFDEYRWYRRFRRSWKNWRDKRSIRALAAKRQSAAR